MQAPLVWGFAYCGKEQPGPSQSPHALQQEEWQCLKHKNRRQVKCLRIQNQACITGKLGARRADRVIPASLLGEAMLLTHQCTAPSSVCVALCLCPSKGEHPGQGRSEVQASCLGVQERATAVGSSSSSATRSSGVRADSPCLAALAALAPPFPPLPLLRRRLLLACAMTANMAGAPMGDLPWLEAQRGGHRVW